MSIASNAEVFKQSFREEGREILADLESALLELNENRDDQELVGRVFRDLHTIKGSGAMFGFEGLAAFTHNLESAFDEVRNGRLQISSELIDLTLSALDQIRAMLEDPNGAMADPAFCAELLTKVRRIAGIAESKPGEGKIAPPETAPKTGSGSESESPAGVAAGPSREWAIHFAPGPDFMLNGTNPLLLLRELKQMGGLAVKASMAAIPPLGELDPERCYVSWDMVLATTADRDAIRDVFIFVEDSCELTVEPASNPVENPAPSALRSAVSVSAPACAAGTVAQAQDEKPAPRAGRRSTDKPDSASSLRVPAAKLDQCVDLVCELVTVQARLSELAAQRDDPEVTEVSEEIERLTSALRENSMNIRMTPIRVTFEKFRRLVHDSGARA